MDDDELDEIPFEGSDLIPDSESEDRERLDKRAEVLGFRPQKEVIHNFLLPYSDQLDEESLNFFRTIKENLLRAILLREMRPGFVTWGARLAKYVKLFGYKFSKEDHVSLIQAMFHIATLPDLEPWLVNKAGSVLVVLLKKKELLTPDDLTLDWRPLYDLYEKVMYSHFEQLGLIHYPPSMDATMRAMIRSCRPYFGPNATQEMLDEWRPLMCPLDVTMGKAIIYMELFLPTFNTNNVGNPPHHLWFDELMKFWQVCHNSPPWEGGCFSIFARLAEHNIGNIDWEPFVPIFFTRIQKNFSLPVLFKQTNVGNKSALLDLVNVTKWIVSTITSGSSTMKYLDQMFRALESYYHPANFGRHSTKLIDFLAKLTNTFIRRLHKERYAKKHWTYNTNPEKKLTNQEVTDFVLSIQPILLHCMYCKVGMAEIGSILQNLATLRPEIVIPPLVERLYLALETLTEPHKLTASLFAVVSVARSLVFPGPHYPDGVTHVIPLMMSTLPGIDPNDMRKSMTTFQFISTFATLVPIVDCSKAHEFYQDLTEEERVICGQTGQFEDFVVQFLDRCFTLINSSSLEETRIETSSNDHRTTRDESMKDIGMASTFSAILMQSSVEIYDVALKKVQAFVEGRIMETKIAGKFAASLVRCLVKIRPEKGMSVFLPKACEVIERLLKDGNGCDEKVDEELKFNLLLLSECVRVPGNNLLPFKAILTKAIRQSIHLGSKDGFAISGLVLRNTLRALTVVCPTEYKASSKGYDRPLKEYLPIRDWGKPGDIHNADIKWHIPREEEINFAQNLIDEFLDSDLNALSDYSAGKLTLKRDELINKLAVVSNVILGCGSVLPFWGNDKTVEGEESPRLLVESVTNLKPLALVTSPIPLRLTLKGKNVRQEISKVAFQLQAHLLTEKEDDTKSLGTLVTIYETLLMFGGIPKAEFDGRWKSFQMVRKVMENRLVGNRKNIRALIVDRALLQHESRLLERSNSQFTTAHQKIIEALLELATSSYSHVRLFAQESLSSCLCTFPHSYKVILPKLVHLIRKDNIDSSHEQLKGALYVILGIKQRTLLVKHNWSVMDELWPTLADSKHSEKPSIARLTDMIIDSLGRYIDTFSLQLHIPDHLIQTVQKCWTFNAGESCPTGDEIAEYSKKQEDSNAANIASYEGLLKKLCNLIESGQLHWRHNNLAMAMVSLLSRHDYPLPGFVVSILVKSLVHDNISVRKGSLLALSGVLKQQKKPHPKMTIDVAKGVPAHPGDREDNLWICYDSSKLPKTEEEWKAKNFVHKTHFGFYSWPEQMKVYAKEGQPDLRRSPDSMNEVERKIFDFFASEANVSKLIGFLSLEEHKGRDKFDPSRFSMFKGLFRNYGDAFLSLFRKQLERLVGESHESSQRCAAEILASLIRGAKHWPFDMTKSLWEWVVPLIRKILEKVTVETMSDWGTCFATASESRDPVLIHWMIEVLMEEPIRSQGAFIDSSRLYALQGALAQQEWRVGELQNRLLEFLRQYLTHPYQNVRERLGSVLTSLFICDLEFGKDGKSSNTRCPKIGDFINEVLPQLESMSVEQEQITPEATSPMNGTIENANGTQFIPGASMAIGQPRMPIQMVPGPGGMPFPFPGVPPGALRMPPPEMFAQMMSRMPNPEQMARLPHPEMMLRMIPPELQARMPPPEQLARMFSPENLAQLPQPQFLPGMPTPEMMARMPTPEMMARMPTPEMMSRMPIPLGPDQFLPGMVPLPFNGLIGMDGIPVTKDSAKSAEYQKRQVAVRLLQTMSKFLTGVLMRAFCGTKSEFFKLLPMLCIHESNDFEPHLARDCTIALSCLSQSILPLEVVPTCIEAISQITKSSSWKAKSAVLELMQVLVFSNLPSFLSCEEWINQIIDIVEGSLRDDRVEVREKAGQVLSGLLHCEFIRDERRKILLDTFSTKVRKKVKRKKSESSNVASVVSRHAAILGLCAFVNAYPYTVPEVVPTVLMVLSDHLHDPQPIPLTIKKTLQDFKRTHQDNWADHKQKFSDDQLAVLTDLLVSPSYYA